VRFEGHTKVTLEPGQGMVSDPVALQVEAFSDLAITFLLAQGESLTGHVGAQQTSYVSGIGDVSATPGEVTFLAYPLLTTSWWLITGIDVLSSTPLNAVVAFGSSTTDSFASTLNANRRWPDYLARRLRDAGGTVSTNTKGFPSPSARTWTLVLNSPRLLPKASFFCPPSAPAACLWARTTVLSTKCIS
jgi:hypothetical protein